MEGNETGFRAAVFRVSGLMGGDNVKGRCELPENGTRVSNEEIGKEGSAASPSSQMEATDESASGDEGICKMRLLSLR